LSRATDKLMVKMTNQALRAKSVEVTDADDEEDADAINAASDGERVRVNRPANYRIEKIEPLIASLLPAVEFLQNQQNQNSAMQARNVGDQGIAKTAKEAMILREQSMVKYGDLNAQVKRYRKTALKVMAFFVDAIIRQAIESPQVPEFRIGASKQPMILTPRDAEFTREHFEFETIDDALAYADPAMRVEQLLATMTQVAAAIAPYLQLGLDPSAIIKRVARESGFSEFEEMLGENGMGMALQVAQGIVQGTYANQGAKVQPMGMQQAGMQPQARPGVGAPQQAGPTQGAPI
jgi:hypothetical protein